MFFKIDTLAVMPIYIGIAHIPLRQVKIFRQLPNLPAAIGKCLAKILRREKMLGRPAIGAILTSLCQFKGTVYFV